MEDELVEKWGNIGLLEGEHGTLKIELVELLEEMFVYLKNDDNRLDDKPIIHVVMFPSVVRIFRKYKRKFDIPKLYREYCEFIKLRSTRDAMDNMSIMGIDAEAEVVAAFCDNYEIDGDFTPFKRLPNFKLKRYE